MIKRLIIIALGLAVIIGVATFTLKKEPKVSIGPDSYVNFSMEAFDKIRENYWSSTTEAALADHFQLSLQKAINSPVVPMLSTRDKKGASKMISDALANATSSEAMKKITLDTLIIALYNLPPEGRAGLFSSKQEKEFRDSVSNIDKNKDLYQNLGLEKGATEAEIKLAAEEKLKALANATSSEAQTEIKQIAYAKDVLTDPNTKDLYDAAKIEPTLKSKVIGNTLYVSMDRISPTTLIEFGRTIMTASTTPNLSSLIIDMRGNIGGALDFSTAFVGLFIGPNQYAYDLFHQDKYDPQRTTTPVFPELKRYEEIAILTDGVTQSTAEVTTASMKRLKLAKVVGEKTRGWGTVENTFPLETKINQEDTYSMLLVHSLTLRDDNQPVESNGVEPDVNIKNKNWKTILSTQFRSTDLITAIKQVIAKKP